MTRAIAASRFAPWAGLVAGPLGWSLHQQGLGDLLHFDCHAPTGMLGVGGALAIVALLALAGFVSWRAARHAPDAARRFLGHASAMAAVLFAFAVSLQAIASAILPPGCGA